MIWFWFVGCCVGGGFGFGTGLVCVVGDSDFVVLVVLSFVGLFFCLLD